MKIINIKNNNQYIKEYIQLCNKEWGKKMSKDEREKYINNKIKMIRNENKVISILGLIDKSILIGFISLLKNDGPYRSDLTPWYATLYVKKEYRNKGYSKILNKAIIDEAFKLGYNKVYLKTNLNNYYEKFGANYIEKLDNNEKLYYININNYN